MRVFVHDDFWTHWKLQRAALRLKLDSTHVGGHLVRLWCWVMRYRSKGRLDGLDDAEISAAAGCPEAQDFVPTLRASGFIDDDNSIHDWMFWQGVLLKKVNRDRAAREKRARGARAARKSPPTSVAVAVAVTTPTPTPMSTPASASLENDAPAPSLVGFHPNREAQHIAQRWAQINPRTLDPAKASHHFAEALLAGVNAKELMKAVEDLKGRKPWKITETLIKPLTAPKAAAPTGERTPDDYLERQKKEQHEAEAREAMLTSEQREKNRVKLEEAMRRYVK